MEQPTLVIIGGANGSGKTTLAREFVALEHFTYLGADEIARELNPQQPEKVAIDAARVFSQRFGQFCKIRCREFVLFGQFLFVLAVFDFPKHFCRFSG